MPLPRDVREQALLASARHCCVCRRYKGVKIEVHHIVPESEGGENTADNAIALCFDCHADAGHYNPNHPRGTKYSQSGLERARDEWYRIVAEQGVPTPSEPDRLYCRYLLCRDMEILKELAALDLTRIPVEQGLLVRNSVFDFWREILDGHEGTARPEHVWGDDFPDEDSYLQERADAEILKQGADGLHYFKAKRQLSREEVTLRVAPQDHITKLLLTSDIPIEGIAQAVAYWEVCGLEQVQEIYLVRPLWFVVFAVSNITDRPLRLTGLNAAAVTGGARDVQPFMIDPGENPVQLPLPAAGLPAGATALIPVATLLPAYRHASAEVLSASREELERGRIQEVVHCAYEPSDIEDFLSWGPRLWPASLGIQSEGEEAIQEVQSLDPTNVYALDRSWEMGSCPHLFLKVGACLQYAGELFGEGPSVLRNESIHVPQGVFELEIAELEEEVTEIHAVRGASKELCMPLLLRKGEVVRVGVTPGRVVEFLGRYLPDAPHPELQPDPSRRNTLVSDWIAKHARLSTGSCHYNPVQLPGAQPRRAS